MNVDKNALFIIEKLHSKGFEAYLVGGCVRDWLLKQKTEDWDIVTSAKPEQIEECFAKTVAVGKAFGIIVVVLNDKEYEVATFRTESDYIDGRRPQKVCFATLEEDVLRRDFTINSLLYDPVEKKIIDIVGGEDDINKKIVRTVGDPEKRFLEDHLRILRAVRFVVKTGFSFDAATKKAVSELAGLVRTVSVERVSSELLKMITSPGAGKVLPLLYETNLLQHVLPELLTLKGCPQPPEFHPEGDVFIHTSIMLDYFSDNIPKDKFAREVLAWAVLLHDIAKPQVISVEGRIRFNRHDYISAEMSSLILSRLKRPKKVIEAVKELIARHIHFSTIAKMREAKRRRFLQDPLFPLHLELHRLDCKSSHGIMDTYSYGVSVLQQERSRPQNEPLFLNGNDLIDLGYQPGPKFSTILAEIADAQLEHKINNKNEAVIWVKQNFSL